MSQIENNNPAFKLCHLKKRSNFDGYGFNLHSEKSKPGQFIGKVDVGSPAEEANLKEGDRIVEVNGISIGNATHKQVVIRIKALESEVRLLLIDVDGKGDGISMATPITPNTENGNGMNEMTTPPPPPSTTMASATSKDTVFSSTLNITPKINAKDTNGNAGNNNKMSTGDGLQLPMTAAEMRATLLSKKKRDPKNESIDLKQKYEIIQQL